VNRFWNSVLRPLVEATGPQTLVEVGVAQGALTRQLLEWASTQDAVVHAIDPLPDIDVAAWQTEHGDRLVFHRSHSLNELGRIDAIDVAFIDGDHNWYTVIHELRLLELGARAAGRIPPLIALHDVDWPYARRDLYYDPESIPAAYRQPYERKGILPGQGELTHEGLNDHLLNGIYEHSIRNGVRTAVEDFIAESDEDWQMFHVPGLSGLGVIVTPDRLAEHPALAGMLHSLTTPEFLTQWCEELDRAVARAHIDVARYAHALEGANAQLDKLRRSAEQRAGEVAGAEQRATQLQVQLTDAERRGAELQVAVDRGAAELTRATREAAAAHEEEARRAGALVRERDAEWQRAAELQAERDAETQRAAELQAERDAEAQRAAELQAERDAEAQRAAELQAERDSEAQRVAELQAERDSEAQRVADLELRQREQTEHLEAELRTQSDQLARTVADLASTREELDEAVQELAAHVDDRDGTAAQLTDEIERLEHQAVQAAAVEADLRHQLIAARAAAEEAEDQRRRSGAGGDGIGSHWPEAALWSELGSALAHVDEHLSRAVAERDPAGSGDVESYLSISRSALGAIVPALGAAGIGRPETILDLPCGYGRVTRALRAAWPSADIVAADQSSAAVAFSVEQFDATGWEVQDYLAIREDESQQGRFDLIWSSLLTMVAPTLIDECLSSLLAMLSPGGVLVAAYHGRDSVRRFSEQSDDRLRAVAQAVSQQGVGFRASPSNSGLGTTAFTSEWLMARLARHRALMVVSVTERGWGDHLDVVAISAQDVHHRQKDLSVGRRPTMGD
jgi:SAM-dependent methyltransferase